jgi:hypothetical protein
MPKFNSSAERQLVACSLWLHIGFIGACGVAAGLLLLLGGEANWPWALCLVSFGGALAAIGWRRGLIVIEYPESPPAVVTQPRAGSTARASSSRTEPSAIATFSSMALQSNRRCDDDARRSTLR